MKSNARKWGSSLPDDWFREHDIRVHVPAGDPEGRAERRRHHGHRGGLARDRSRGSRRHGDDRRLTLAGRSYRSEASEKALAAQRAGVRRVIAPRLNQADLEDIHEAPP